MRKSIQWALMANALGFLLSIPCLLHTTPINMVVFFFVSVPLFAVGFLLYMMAVITDLRSHKVL
jgi:hypothetical protein